MKKVLLLVVLTLTFISCDTDDENETVTPTVYDIEGKWVVEGSIPEGNTMYLYEDGLRYTYYCVEGDCNSLYNSYEANDGNHIPNPLNYAYIEGVLTVDLNFGNELVTPITFTCDGGEAIFETPGYSLFRLNSNCN